MEQCGRLLVQMMCRGDARYFNTLVSDTTTMIYHPLIAPAAAARAAAARAQTDFIDLSIVAHRLRVGGYSGVLGFRQDVLRVLATAASPPGCLPADEPPNVGAGRRLASWFAERFKPLEPHHHAEKAAAAAAAARAAAQPEGPAVGPDRRDPLAPYYIEVDGSRMLVEPVKMASRGSCADLGAVFGMIVHPLLQSLFIRTYLTVWARAASPLLPGEEVSAGQCQRHSNGAVCADLLVQEDASEDESDGWVASRQCGHGRRRADRQGFGVQSGGLQPALS